jgi:hypothetical protein
MIIHNMWQTVRPRKVVGGIIKSVVVAAVTKRFTVEPLSSAPRMELSRLRIAVLPSGI